MGTYIKIKYIICYVLILVNIPTKALNQIITIPEIVSVDINQTTQKAVIKWDIDISADIDGFIIKRQIFNQTGVVDGTFNTIAVIDNKNIREYEDISTFFGEAKPYENSEYYRVTSFKYIDGAKKYSNMSKIMSSIFLFPVEFDVCSAQNTLKWNSAIGWEGASKIPYNIYNISQTQNKAILIGTTNDTTFIHKGLSSKTQYQYYIQINTDKQQAKSNDYIINSNLPENPKYLNADYASIVSENNIEVSFTVDDNKDSKTYILTRSLSKTANFENIRFFKSPISKIKYIDTVNSTITSYYYKLISLNICDNVSNNSNLAHNIILDVKIDDLNKKINNLNWTAYTTWNGALEKYNIYRSFDNNEFEFVQSTTDLSFSDDISKYTKSEFEGKPAIGQFCYYVKAIEDDTNPYDIKGVSKSNIACITQEPIFYVANVFSPNSNIEQNREFKPKLTFVSDYQMIIYNKWGEKIFETKNLSDGWNGKIKGKLVQKGVYVYYISFKNASNSIIKKYGQISLIY